MTLQALADACHTTHQQISNLESGKRKLTWEWMQRLAKGLECHPLDLVEGPASAPKPADERERELLRKFRGLEDGEKRIFSHMLDGVAKGDNKEQDDNNAKDVSEKRR